MKDEQSEITISSSNDLGDLHEKLTDLLTLALEENKENNFPLSESELLSGSASIMIKIFSLYAGNEASIRFLNSWIMMLSTEDDTPQ